MRHRHAKWELMRYAVEQRNYIALVALFLRQKWLRETCSLSIRLSGYVVIVVGVSLIVFVTVVLARDAVPTVAGRGTALYHCLLCLVAGISYSALHCYVCAATFSLRLGHGGSAHRGARARRDEGRDTSASSGSSTDDVDCEEPLVRQSHRRDGTPTAAVGAAAVPVLSTSSLPGDVARQGAHSTVAVGSTPRQRQTCPDRPHAGDEGVRPPASRWGRLVVCRDATGLLSSACHRLSLLLQWRRTADPDVLEALDGIAEDLEAYSAAERRYKLLDPARRFCRHCERLKAPREHHCSVCRRCVPKMDHHCLFINSCVDTENQRYFYLLVFWLFVGTLCANLFFGGACGRQWWWRWRRHRALARAQAEAEAEEEAALAVGPYGPDGSQLTSFPMLLALSLTAVMFAAMCLFMYVNTQQLLGNVTSIEMAIVHDKRSRVFRSTSFVYRTPYDLGAWRNLLECFRTLEDPLVRVDLARDSGSAGEGDRLGVATALLGVLPPPPRTAAERQLRGYAWRLALLVWLFALPTLRPTGCDGLHYPLYDRETRDLDGYCIAGHGRRVVTAEAEVDIHVEEDEEGARER